MPRGTSSLGHPDASWLSSLLTSPLSSSGTGGTATDESLGELEGDMDLYALEDGQDDPAKCTGSKMVRMEMVRSVHRKLNASDGTDVLDRFGYSTIYDGASVIMGRLCVDRSRS